MKLSAGLGVLLMVSGLLVQACGRLKPDSSQAKEHKLGPAPSAAADSAPTLEPMPEPIAGPDSAARLIGPPDSFDINKERRFASIQDLAADKYIGCNAPVLCNGLAYFDCNVKGGGSGLYYDTATVSLVSRCGSYCVNPDEEQKKMCDSSCPPKAWAGCPRG